MSKTNWLTLHDGEQTLRDDSYVGGKPKLPADCGVPICSLCRQKQTFFLQVAFPADHCWTGLALAIFSCTSCAELSYCIPQMLDGPLANADIVDGFLSLYQNNFAFIVFSQGSAEMFRGYRERIRFRRIELTTTQPRQCPPP